MSSSKPSATGAPRALSVAGMHCVSCQGRVKQALEGLNGVEYADVDLDAGRVVVHFADSPISDEVLVEAVKQAGYQAEADPRSSPDGQVTTAAPGQQAHRLVAPDVPPRLGAGRRSVADSVGVPHPSRIRARGGSIRDRSLGGHGGG